MSLIAEMGRDPPPTAEVGLRISWQKEEAKFASTVPGFQREIAEANSRQRDTLYMFKPEDPPPKKEEPPKNLAAKEGKQGITVESIIVGDHHKIGSSAMQPKSESEVKMNTTPTAQPGDVVLDDFFGEPEQKAKPAAPAVATPTSKRDDDEDIFGIDTTPRPAPHQGVDEEVKAQMSAVADEVKASKKADTIEPPKALKLEAKEVDFDQDKFGRLQEVVARILAGVPNVDLDYIENHLGEYSVTWDIDHLRENPQALTDKLLAIQINRDALYNLTRQFVPVFYAMKHADKYISDVGIDCSNASSKEKRLAQVMAATSDFWVRHAKVTRTKEAIDHTYQHLEGQYEFASRMISGFQMQNKIGEMSRGALPFEPDEPRPAPSPAPVKPPVTQPGPTTTKASPNLGAKFVELETFDPAAKKAANQASFTGTTEVDF